MKYDIEFFNELMADEQNDILYAARAYFRVRELDKSKQLGKSSREYYKRLFEKLDEQLEQEDE